MRTVYKVLPDSERWAIKREGEYTPVSILPHKNEAVKAARDMAERDMPSRLIVIDGRGKVEMDKLYGTDQLEADVQGMRAMEEPLPEGLQAMPEMEEEES
ncbi:MAG: DUF2188 domain-containing protein [Pseudomonadota bacterium]|nr:DUF2188 domain-containing protein [Pseudomonadota bacterium]